MQLQKTCIYFGLVQAQSHNISMGFIGVVMSLLWLTLIGWVRARVQLHKMESGAGPTPPSHFHDTYSEPCTRSWNR